MAVAPDRPLPASGITDAARGLWRKIVLFSSQIRGFAPSREPVTSARPASCPLDTSACQAIQPALTTAASPNGPAHRRPGKLPGHERRKSVALRLPRAASGGPQGWLNCRTH
ncbi:MAG: hypothetical protein WAW52_02180 [Methanothrix sp.]